MDDSRAFARLLGWSLASVAVVVAVAALLGPIGAIRHLVGFVTAACTELPHIVSDVASFGLVALVVGSAAATGAALVGAVVADRWFRSVEARTAPLEAEQRVRRLQRLAGVRGTVTVFEDAERRAWTRGLLRPRISISSAAVVELPDEELVAVLAHEEHHRRRRDPLRILVAEVLARVAFAFPVVAAAAADFRRWAEFAADDQARAVAGPTASARALLRFAGPARPRPVLTADVTGAGVSERVRRLIDDERVEPGRLAGVWVTVCVTGLAAVSVALVAVLPGM